MRWLALGWADLRRNPLPGLIHGFMLTAFGGILVWSLQDWFWVLAGAFSGFLIVAPILATGLYQVSRGLSVGRRVDIFEVMELWTNGDGRAGALWHVAGAGRHWLDADLGRPHHRLVAGSHRHPNGLPATRGAGTRDRTV